MLKMREAVITNGGIEIQILALQGKQIEFTKLETGSGKYTEEEQARESLKQRTCLKIKRQEFGISTIKAISDNMVSARSVITNKELKETYIIRELGLYARIRGNPETERLISISLAESEDTIPAYDGKEESMIINQYQFGISDTDNVNLSYMLDPVALAEDVDNKIEELKGLRASFDEFGMVKLTDSSTVTDSTGLALAALEKNANINGTLANQILELKKSVSDGKAKVAAAITDKGVETATNATFAVMADNIAKIETDNELHGAVISVTTDESALIGKDVVLSKDGSTVETKSFDDNGTCSFVVQASGTYTITSSDGIEDAKRKVEVTDANVINKTVLLCELIILMIVSFADGTDEEIAAMVAAHYANKINISDYWAVGDMRSVDLAAMAATGVSESHRAQTVQYVIGDFDHDELTTPINGHTKAAITLLQKDCLMDEACALNPSSIEKRNTEEGYMHNTQKYVAAWKSCVRRTWCNNVYFAALPVIWQNLVKIVNKKGTVGSNSSRIDTTQDKIFLAAEIEVFGSTTYSLAGEGTQYQYYKNATANRYKMPKGKNSFSSIWWERSPKYDTNNEFDNFCSVHCVKGTASANSVFVLNGIAPCFCI